MHINGELMQRERDQGHILNSWIQQSTGENITEIIQVQKAFRGQTEFVKFCEYVSFYVKYASVRCLT